MSRNILLQTKEYFDSPMLSQSKLKNLINNPSAFLLGEEENDFEEKSSLLIGSAVDDLFREKALGQNIGDFEKTYYIDTLKKKPSEAIAAILRELYSRMKELPTLLGDIEDLESGYLDDIILDICANNNYGQSYTKPVRLKKVYEEKAYLKALLEAGDRKVLSQEEKDKVDSIVHKILMTPSVREALKLDDQENYKTFAQVPVYFEFNGKGCKALLDFLIVNRVGDCDIVDLKTTGFHSYEIKKSLDKYRYDIQGAYYVEAINSPVKTVLIDNEIIARNLNATSVFKLVVASTKFETDPVLTFTFTEELLSRGLIGDQYKIGLTQLFDKLDIHLEKDDFSVPTEFLEEDLYLNV